MRALAYRRSVLHSAAADYGHCGHLTTSGGREDCRRSPDGGPAWLCCDLGCVCQVFSLSLDWAEPAAQFSVMPSTGDVDYDDAARLPGGAAPVALRCEAAVEAVRELRGWNVMEAVVC